jgi:hypothetical protein
MLNGSTKVQLRFLTRNASMEIGSLNAWLIDLAGKAIFGRRTKRQMPKM